MPANATQLESPRCGVLDDQRSQLARARQTRRGLDAEPCAGLAREPLYHPGAEHCGGSPNATNNGGAQPVADWAWELSGDTGRPRLRRAVRVGQRHEHRPQHDGCRRRDRAPGGEQSGQLGAEPEQDRADHGDDDEDQAGRFFVDAHSGVPIAAGGGRGSRGDPEPDRV